MSAFPVLRVIRIINWNIGKVGKLLFGKVQCLPGILVFLHVMSENADFGSRNSRKAPAGTKRVLQTDRCDETAVPLTVSVSIYASEVK